MPVTAFCVNRSDHLAKRCFTIARHPICGGELLEGPLPFQSVTEAFPFILNDGHSFAFDVAYPGDFFGNQSGVITQCLRKTRYTCAGSDLDCRTSRDLIVCPSPAIRPAFESGMIASGPGSPTGRHAVGLRSRLLRTRCSPGHKHQSVHPNKLAELGRHNARSGPRIEMLSWVRDCQP